MRTRPAGSRSTPTSSWISAGRGRTKFGSRGVTHPLTPSAIPLEHSGAWLAIAGFGAYHGLNPGMGWLFALALGLEQRRERAIWIALGPIALGHAASLALVAAGVFLVGALLSPQLLEFAAAGLLVGFGVYK